MQAREAGLSLFGILVADAIAIVGLHAAGRLPWLDIDWSDLSTWLATTPPEDAVAAVLRIAGLAAAYWLLTTTIVYVASRAGGRALLADAVGRAAVPGVRAIADRALALTLATGALTLPALPAAGQQPTTSASSDEAVVVREGDLFLPPGLEPAPAPSRQTPRAADAEPPPQVDSRTADPTTMHRVQAGDTLWSIAAARVDAGTDGVAGERDIARYWLRLVAENRARLASGDPDLIFPGEQVVLPDLPSAGSDAGHGTERGDS